jgi:hypothetical protein
MDIGGAVGRGSSYKAGKMENILGAIVGGGGGGSTVVSAQGGRQQQ